MSTRNCWFLCPSSAVVNARKVRTDIWQTGYGGCIFVTSFISNANVTNDQAYSGKEVLFVDVRDAIE